MAAVNPINDRKRIPTLVKNSALVEERRRRIVEAAVGLFISKGFHRTTTREIARAGGFSIGSLYEYVASKEDILYLVCESIHAEMEAQLGRDTARGETCEAQLSNAIQNYIAVCDRMQDSILLIYRETASLPKESRRYVLRNEERIAGIFQKILETGVRAGAFKLAGAKSVQLMAHNIVVLGHMWAYRRWFLRGKFTLEEYIANQTSLLMGELTNCTPDRSRRAQTQ